MISKSYRLYRVDLIECIFIFCFNLKKQRNIFSSNRLFVYKKKKEVVTVKIKEKETSCGSVSYHIIVTCAKSFQARNLHLFKI